MDFKLTYWSRRWKAETTLTVRKIDTGWHISHVAIYGDTDHEGAPILEANLNQDHVKFPADVGAFLGFVWEQLDSCNIDAERAQQMIQEIGDWITACETLQPVWKVWNS
jgi:hypothetical protein